jgi:hypothetical protein
MGHGDDLQPVRLRELAHRRVVSGKYRLEWLLLFPFRMARRHLANPRKRKRSLSVQGMFRPKRAVLVKRSDAIRWLNILGTGFVGRVSYESKDRCLCRAIIPRWQGIALCCLTASCHSKTGREDSDCTRRNKRPATHIADSVLH